MQPWMRSMEHESAPGALIYLLSRSSALSKASRPISGGQSSVSSPHSCLTPMCPLGSARVVAGVAQLDRRQNELINMYRMLNILCMAVCVLGCLIGIYTSSMVVVNIFKWKSS